MKVLRPLALVPALLIALAIMLVPNPALAYDGESSSSSTYVDVPPVPEVDDPCGANNATWLSPLDDEMFDWEVAPETGELTTTIKPLDTYFTGTTDTVHNYGVAVDSGVLCDQTIAIPDFKIRAKCGPDNDQYVLPDDSRVPYSVVRHLDRSLTVTADEGIVFENGQKVVEKAAPKDIDNPCWTSREKSCLNGVFSTAHRGMGVGAVRFGGQLWAEDTLPALTKGLDLGACAVESDFYETRNGCIVSHHDPTLNRMTNRSGPIQRKSCAYVLGAVNPGGAHVATLDTIMKTLERTAPGTCFRQWELKGWSVSRSGLHRMVKTVNQYSKSEACITYTSGSVSVLRYIHKLSPGSTFGLIHRSVYGRPVLDRLPGFIGRTMIDYHAVSPDYVKRARQMGIEVSARNVDTPAIYNQMRHEGVHVMVTDVAWMSVW